MREPHFDPLGELSTASFAKPAKLSPVNLRVLSPFQRCLLVIDGTVTKFLEAYTLEPIEIRQLSHTVTALPESNPWLDAPKGTEVAERQVLIEAAYSKALYVYACSLVILDRLPEPVRQRLQIPGEGLGRVLNEHKVESRREVLWFGRERTTELNDVMHEKTNGEFMTRTYRIIHRSKPAALITEKFPIEIEHWLSHH